MMRITADKMMIIRVLTSSCADVVSVVVVVVVVVIVVVVVAQLAQGGEEDQVGDGKPRHGATSRCEKS